ncbi:threonine-phosphate decarboxylase [Clostridium tepidiprofundi DSM 19306]|uniref:Threonine-phosphate decarboxylase n=1 Tax=Clostridium tepidiprofundi DSM 19306 TaxID=1121338 RepID=A0A151B6J7_9CLOT|nr:histidinol-phosphate transaminase [Clostridium tepidiprofundi]KYH35519.1 threonine-phosphate decarboxylase [Clostridium tepidiprofundi DSM 19306]
MIHGGDVYTDGILKGIELLDYSSNINPLGIPYSFINNINSAINNLVRYPDIEYRKVKYSLKEYTNVSSEEFFVLGNGAAEIIDLAISMLKRILIVVPSFVEYEINAKKWGCKIEYSHLIERNYDKTLHDFTYDYKDILNKLKYVDGIIIGHPNNPNGSIIDKDEFKNILMYCENNGKIIIVDEAFIEFTGNIDDSFISEVEKYKCLIIIRALTKFFSMPGIRFGYGISSNKKLVELIKMRQNPWNINAFAEVAVQNVLKDKEYIHNTLEWIREEKEFMIDKLKRIYFINKVYRTNVNYVLCETKNIDCYKLYEECLKRNILIRMADNYRGLDKYYVRFAIKDRESNVRFLNVLSSI